MNDIGGMIAQAARFCKSKMESGGEGRKPRARSRRRGPDLHIFSWWL
jgi:hypothetical protein